LLPYFSTSRLLDEFGVRAKMPFLFISSMSAVTHELGRFKNDNYNIFITSHSQYLNGQSMFGRFRGWTVFFVWNASHKLNHFNSSLSYGEISLKLKFDSYGTLAKFEWTLFEWTLFEWNIVRMEHCSIVRMEHCSNEHCSNVHCSNVQSSNVQSLTV